MQVLKTNHCLCCGSLVPTCFSRNDALETHCAKVKLSNQNIDHLRRGGVRHVVIQALGKRSALASMLSLDEIASLASLADLNPSNHSKVDANVSTQPGQISALSAQRIAMPNLPSILHSTLCPAVFFSPIP